MGSLASTSASSTHYRFRGQRPLAFIQPLQMRLGLYSPQAVDLALVRSVAGNGFHLALQIIPQQAGSVTLTLYQRSQWLGPALAGEEQLGQDKPAIAVDCTDLSYISSAGLGVFMSYIEDLKVNQQ